MMKKRYSYHYLNEGLSLLCILYYIGFVWVETGKTPEFVSILLALAFGCAVKLMLPTSDESAKKSFTHVLAIIALCIISALLSMGTALTLLLLMLFVFADFVLRIFDRYLYVRPLFKQIAVWTSIENHARNIYGMAFLLLCSLPILTEVYKPPLWLKWIELSLFLAEYALLTARSHSGRSFIIGKKKEDSIKNITSTGLRMIPEFYDGKDEVAKMNVLYEKIVSYMESKRPFLDENFSLNSLASSVFTNKTYLSKTINVIAGRNFCQFVNYYRVKYSIELMKNQPKLKVFELANLSGFHSVVSYNMAFKLNMDETPSEYFQRLKLDLIQLPSNLMGQEQ